MPSEQPPKSDRELIELLGQGDEKAFEIVFNTYFEKLSLFSESITHDHDAAEEIVEDVFLKVWLNCEINPIEKSIKSYLFRCVYNNSLKFVTRSRKNLVSLEAAYDGGEGQSDSDYPVANMILQEIEEKAGLIISSLPAQCKQIYLLNRDHDMRYQEIAESLHISVGTVKTQMSRAFEKLRKGLSEFLYLIF